MTAHRARIGAQSSKSPPRPSRISPSMRRCPGSTSSRVSVRAPTPVSTSVMWIRATTCRRSTRQASACSMAFASAAACSFRASTASIRGRATTARSTCRSFRVVRTRVPGMCCERAHQLRTRRQQVGARAIRRQSVRQVLLVRAGAGGEQHAALDRRAGGQSNG